jgi:hypothetical protein
VNYSAQDAVTDFYVKPAAFFVYLDICYQLKAPQNVIKFEVTQHKKEIVPLSVKRSPYQEPAAIMGYLPPNGEQIAVEFTPSKIDSSDLTIIVDTPDGQHAQLDLDLSTVR